MEYTKIYYKIYWDLIRCVYYLKDLFEKKTVQYKLLVENNVD